MLSFRNKDFFRDNMSEKVEFIKRTSKGNGTVRALNNIIQKIK